MIQTDLAPITEYWLEKFGFKSIGLSGCVFAKPINDKDSFVIEVFDYVFYPMINYDTIWCDELKYVHQLQNYYFAVMGEELHGVLVL